MVLDLLLKVDTECTGTGCNRPPEFVPPVAPVIDMFIGVQVNLTVSTPSLATVLSIGDASF